MSSRESAASNRSKPAGSSTVESSALPMPLPEPWRVNLCMRTQLTPYLAYRAAQNLAVLCSGAQYALMLLSPQNVMG